MKDIDLNKIMSFIGDRARSLIPYSDNLDSNHKRVDRATRNRFIQLRAKRTWVRDLQKKAQIKNISFWNLDLASDELGDRNTLYLNTRDMLLELSLRKERTAHKNNEEYTTNEFLEDSAAQAIYWQIGNCGELADLATFMYDEYPEDGDFGLPEIDGLIRVELIDLPDRVHSFLLVNRPGHTDIKEPKEFLNAYIHDVHTKEIYQIKELLTYDEKLNKYQMLPESKKFQYAEEIFQHINNFKVLCTTYIGANSLHSQRWRERTNNSDKAYKWWKRDEFLRMPDQKQQPKQEILDYPELVNKLIEKWYETHFDVDNEESSMKRALKKNIEGFDGRDIELLNQAKISGVMMADLILDDISNYFKNKADVAKIKINIGKMSDTESSSSSSDEEEEQRENTVNSISCQN